MLIKLVPGGARAMDLPAVWDVFLCALSPLPESVPQELKHGLKMFLLVTRLGDAHASDKCALLLQLKVDYKSNLSIHFYSIIVRSMYHCLSANTSTSKVL